MADRLQQAEHMRDRAARYDLLVSLAAIAAILAIAAALHAVLHRPNATIGALLLLLVVLVAATRARFRAAVGVSLAAMLAFNFFFLPPVETFTIADPQNWVALFVFLAVATIAGELSAAARERAREAEARRGEVSRLFDLSRDILRTSDGDSSIAELAGHVAGRFDVESLAIGIRDQEGWAVYEGGRRPLSPAHAALDRVLADGRSDASDDVPAAIESGIRASGSMILAPLRLGSSSIGVLAIERMALDAATLDAVSGLVALAIERTAFLRERKDAELVAQRAELASALLASISHDLRTPLTAVRTAVANLQAPGNTDAGRRAQANVALAGIDRLSRLFDDILDMARIDASAVSITREWVTAADIVDAAIAQAGPLFDERTIRIDADETMLVHVDPRLTSSALVHLLENAARYGGDPVEVGGWPDAQGLTLTVRDHGPGLAPADIGQVFDRFYRGAAGRHGAGIGMGLAITRGLLAAEGGRVCAANAPGGGASFTIAVPGPVRPVDYELP
jgi:two-component system, OmpR family, sensor histidine kinase KdpD